MQIKDFSPYITKIKASGAQSVLTGNYGPDLNLLLKAAVNAGLDVRFDTYLGHVIGAATAMGADGEGRVTSVLDDHDNIAVEEHNAEAEAFFKKWRATHDFMFIGVTGVTDPRCWSGRSIRRVPPTRLRWRWRWRAWSRKIAGADRTRSKPKVSSRTNAISRNPFGRLSTSAASPHKDDGAGRPTRHIAVYPRKLTPPNTVADQNVTDYLPSERGRRPKRTQGARSKSCSTSAVERDSRVRQGWVDAGGCPSDRQRMPGIGWKPAVHSPRFERRSRAITGSRRLIRSPRQHELVRWSVS